MLAHARLAVAAAAGLAAVVLPAAPAAGQVDPDPIDCRADPTAAQCRDVQPPPEGGDRPDDPGRVCSFGGAQVPCRTPFGFWVGDVVDGDWYGMDGDVWPALLVGCWARVTAPDRDPPTSYPGQAPTGAWYTLSCLGPGGAWPAPGPVEFGLAWAPEADDAPDVEALARRALASITLRPPELVLSPPPSGSVLLGMPVWLAVQRTQASWGPIGSGQVCRQGLCVEVTATAQRIVWRTADSSPPVVCGRERNIAWRPGMDFLAPGDACHHFYTIPSRGEPGGRFALSATVIWRAEWSGEGQSGAFTDIDQVCGAAGDEPCQAGAAVRVDEMHVLVRR